MKLKKIQRAELSVGRPVPWDIYSETSMLMLCKGFTLDRDSTIDALVNRGAYRKMTDAEIAAEAASGALSTEYRQAEYVAFKEMNERALKLKGLFSGTNGAGDFTEELLAVAAHIQEACIDNPDVALAALMMTNAGSMPYLIKHAVDTAVIVEVVTAYLRVPRAERLTVMAAALTKDIALADKEITAEENNAHPQASVAILQDLGVNDALWLNAVLQHHERYDGTGYPNQLSEAAIVAAAQVLHLADLYALRIAPPSGVLEELPQAILKSLFLQRGAVAAPRLVEQTVKALGMYPPGCLVRLMNGETGIVIERGLTVNNPKVKSFLGPRNGIMDPPRARDTGFSRDFEVQSVLFKPPVDFPLNSNDIWDPSIERRINDAMGRVSAFG